MKFLKKNKNNKGLTLVELLVTIGVFIIISSMAVISHRSASGAQKLKMSAQKLASDIRKMQSFVLNLQEHHGGFPDGGWGIVLYNNAGEEDHYILFADSDGDTVYDDDGTELYMDIKLPVGIKFSAWKGDGVDISSNSRLVASFQPPDPSVTLCRSQNNNNCTTDVFDIVELVLSNNDNSITRTIEINKYGLIDVQN